MTVSQRRLAVVLAESISAWVAKGEVIDRYLNPGDVFDDIDVISLTDDRPDRDSLRRMAGRARVEVHHVPRGWHLFVRTFGYRPVLLRRWSRSVTAEVAKRRPSLIRAYGTDVNAFAAVEAGRHIGVPVVVSVHINPDEDIRRRAVTVTERLLALGTRRMEAEALRGADLVLPVYEPIVPYLERIGVSRNIVAYNMINASNLRPKEHYELSRPPRVVTVGRQIPEKDPSPIIEAVAAMEDIRLTVIGDGPLHDDLRSLARRLGAGERVTFVRALPNDELCARLQNEDIFAVRSDYWEISKVMLEALLTGLPTVVSHRAGAPVPELADDVCRTVEPTASGFRTAFEDLLHEDRLRTTLGKRARAVADERWSPASTEAAFVSIYEELLSR